MGKGELERILQEHNQYLGSGRRLHVLRVESIAVKPDKYSQHILEAPELPDFEIDFSLDADADQETPDKAVV